MIHSFLLIISLLATSVHTDKKTAVYDADLENSPVAVVQLFTSQGCSSRPPADVLLSQIKEDFNNENVVTLSYHVDYWNRLGWKDPYSDAMFSELQYQYNTAFGNRRVYTPQAIINGKEYYVGSRKQALYDAINKQLQTSSSNGLRIQSKDSGNDAVTFQYTIEGPLQDRTLHFSVALDQQTTAVKRGENRGEKLTNSNIVFVQKDLKPNSRKGEFTIQIPKKYQHTSNWVLTGYVQDPKMIIHAAHQIVL